MSMTKNQPLFDKIVNEDRPPEPMQIFGVPLKLIRTRKTALGRTIEYYKFIKQPKPF